MGPETREHGTEKPDGQHSEVYPVGGIAIRPDDADPQAQPDEQDRGDEGHTGGGAIRFVPHPPFLQKPTRFARAYWTR